MKTEDIEEMIQKEVKPEAKSKKKGKKEDIKTILALDVEGVIDVLDDKGKTVYLLDSGEVVESITTEEAIYTPPPVDNLPYLLADKETVLRLISSKGGVSGGDLYSRLHDYHKSLSDLPSPLFYDLLVLWDVHTYFLDKLHFSPILYLYAVKERGKSRTGKGCIYVSPRGVFTETIREPDIIRWGNDHKAVLGFDVKDFPKKIQRANCDDLLLARFEKGSTSSRTLFPDKGAFKDQKTFQIFGPTIVMTNRPVDDILESRAISIDMKPTPRRFNKPVVAKDALELKAELVAFKYLNRHTDIGQYDKPADGRLGDILSSLNNIMLTFFPEKKEVFQKLLEKIANQKQEDATDTLEAQIVEAVIKSEPLVEKGFLPIEEIAKLFNQDRDERYKIDNRTIGRISKGLGFSSRKSTHGKRGIYYDKELIESVAYQYGLEGMSKTVPQTPPKTSDDKDLASGNGIVTEEDEKSIESLMEDEEPPEAERDYFV